MITYVTHINDTDSLAKHILNKYHINIKNIFDNNKIKGYLYVYLYKKSDFIYHTWCHNCSGCNDCHIGKSFKDCIDKKPGKTIFWNNRKLKLNRILNAIEI